MSVLSTTNASVIADIHCSKFNPVDLALQLLDDGTSGKSEESFRRTKTLLGRALKGSVERAWARLFLLERVLT